VKKEFLGELFTSQKSLLVVRIISANFIILHQKQRRLMTMIHQIGRQLRQQIHYFSGELCKGMGTVVSRFFEEAVFGISSSGSVRLTEIGRALEEKIPLHATHKRLSRNLADQSLEHNIGSNVLKLGSKRIKENTLLIVDPSDIQKKYAKKMQYLAKVRDASEDTIGNGYSLC